MLNDFKHFKILQVDKVLWSFIKADCTFRDNEPNVMVMSCMVEGTGAAWSKGVVLASSKLIIYGGGGTGFCIFNVRITASSISATTKCNCSSP